MTFQNLPVTTLEDFFKAMQLLKKVRERIVEDIIQGKSKATEDLEFLSVLKQKLENLPKHDDLYVLKVNREISIHVDLDYELGELEKDSIFLQYGFPGLENYLNDIHLDFRRQLQEGLEFLAQKKFDFFVTDRDGTISNYCGRYPSSIQPIYNALCLSRFAKSIERQSVILTSAPLFDVGLADVSIQPKGEYILAGSKGREVLINDSVKAFPVPKAQQEKLNELNFAIDQLLQDDAFAIFRYIGSGFQQKFGQTTIARQNNTKAIPLQKSKAWKNKIERLLKDLDPEKRFFSVEDTGKDLEIMLNIETEEKSLEEFTKGHGLKFTLDQLQENIKDKDILICGDTLSDVPLISAAQELGAKVTSIFVTQDKKLQDMVKSLCRDSLFVSSSDTLINLLYTIY